MVVYWGKTLQPKLRQNNAYRARGGVFPEKQVLKERFYVIVNTGEELSFAPSATTCEGRG